MKKLTHTQLSSYSQSAHFFPSEPATALLTCDCGLFLPVHLTHLAVQLTFVIFCSSPSGTTHPSRLSNTNSNVLVLEPRGLTHMAEGFEPSIQHYSTDIYKPQQSLLIEEHMFLLFCAETPPRAAEAPPPLKGAFVYESHWERGRRIVLYSLSAFLLLVFFFFFTLLFPHTRSTSGHLQCVCETWEVEKDSRKVSTAVQPGSHVEPIVWLTRVYIWDRGYCIYSVSVCVFWGREKKRKRARGGEES